MFEKLVIPDTIAAGPGPGNTDPRVVAAMGCDITSNITSLVVLNLPGDLAGREKERVGGCRAEGFGIWPTLSEPVQVRIAILNQLTKEAVVDIIARFASLLQCKKWGLSSTKQPSLLMQNLN